MINMFDFLTKSVQKDFNCIIPQGKRVIFTIKGQIALEQIIESANLQGKKIILPAFTWSGFIRIFSKYNITPIFIDIDPQTFHMDNRLIEEKIDPDIAAIITDHIYGLPDPKVENLKNIAMKNDLILIEDCARALGAKHKGHLVGSFGQFAFYSLHKCMPLSKGGLGIGDIISNSLLPSKIESKDLTNLALKFQYPLKRVIVALIKRLREIDYFNDKRRENESRASVLDPRQLDSINKILFYLYLPYYRRTLKNRRRTAKILIEELEDLGFRPQKDPYRSHIYTTVAVKVPEKSDRERVFSTLLNEGIETQIIWHPTIIQNEYAIKKWGINPRDYPHSIELAEKIINFPYTAYLKINQIQKIKKILRKILQ